MNIGVKEVLLYLLVINILGFLAMGIDKQKAKMGNWRILETKVYSLCI